jgi:hypothetical protein
MSSSAVSSTVVSLVLAPVALADLDLGFAGVVLYATGLLAILTFLPQAGHVAGTCSMS